MMKSTDVLPEKCAKWGSAEEDFSETVKRTFPEFVAFSS